MKEKIKKYLWKPIWFHMVGIIFCFFQITGYIISNNEKGEWGYNFTLILVFSVLFGIAVGYAAFAFCEKYLITDKKSSTYGSLEKQQNTQKKQKNICKIALLSWIIIILCWLPIFIAYFPGIGSYDFGNQMISYIQGTVSTHHPVLHTELMGDIWLWAYTELESGTIGMALYCAMQILMLSVAFTYTVIVLYLLGMSGKMAFITAFVFGVFPLNGYMAISATKDSIFSAFFILFFAALLYFVINPAKNMFYWINLIVLCLAETGVVCFRNNGRYALLVLCVGIVIAMFLDRKSGKTYAIIGVITAVTLFCSLKGLQEYEKDYWRPSADENEKYSVVFMQLARTAAYHKDEIDAEIMDFLEECFGENFYEAYDPVLADNIKDAFKTEHLKDSRFKEVYIQLFKEYPCEYLNAFLALNAGYLYVFDTSCHTPYTDGNEKGYGYIITNENPIWMESIGIYKHSGLPGLYNWLEEIFSSNALMKIPVLGQILAPAIWLYMYLFLLAGCITFRKIKHLVPLTFVGGLYATILLGPVVLMRYVYPIMLCMMVYLLRNVEVLYYRMKQKNC